MLSNSSNMAPSAPEIALFRNLKSWVDYILPGDIFHRSVVHGGNERSLYGMVRRIAGLGAVIMVPIQVPVFIASLHSPRTIIFQAQK